MIHIECRSVCGCVRNTFPKSQGLWTAVSVRVEDKGVVLISGQSGIALAQGGVLPVR